MKAVLFDAAGTLIELREPAGDSYARVAREHGVALPPALLARAFARALREAPPMRFPDVPPDRVARLEKDWWRDVVRATFRAARSDARFADFDAFFEELYRHFSRAAAWRARPGAHAALAALRARGLRTGVVSNFDHRLPAILRGLGLAALLDAVVLPCETRAAKPDPAVFAAALERLGVAASDAAFVGDDDARDLAAARAAGLWAIDVGDLATLGELPDRIARREDARPHAGAHR